MGQTPTIQQRRAAVAAASSLLAGLGDAVVTVGNDDLGPFLREVDDLSRQMEAARVALLGEALSRGVGAGSDAASAAAWVIQWAPSLRSGGAAALVTVAHATRAARNAGLAAAVLGGRVGVRNAAVALVEMDKLGPRLREEAVEAVWAGFVQVATDHGPQQIRGLRDQLIAAHGHEGEFQRRQDQLKAGVSLSQPFDDDGMAEYRLRLDPEGKEVLEAILGPLSAPKPTPTCADLRNCDQRRGDALVEICLRAAAAGTCAPAPKAALWVTVGLADLQTGAGAGSTLGGQLLGIETIRRIACDAMIIPVVMGTGPRSWTWAGPSDCSPAGCWPLCGFGTRAARSPGAPRPRRGPTRTTSFIGSMAGRRAC
jgi:Domain of unknown function (DUF222)